MSKYPYKLPEKQLVGYCSFELSTRFSYRRLSSTLCISNGGQSAINETNMNKINNSGKMNKSARNPATTYTHNR